MEDKINEKPVCLRSKTKTAAATRGTDELEMLAGMMKMFSHLTACSQRAMSEQQQAQALQIRAWQRQECNTFTVRARCPAPGLVAGTALTSR